MIRLLALLSALFFPLLALAESYDDVIEARLLPGWRLPDGDHMAGLEMRLAPGWKTYWRTPGDAGIPPQFTWRGTRNTTAVGVHWPAPHVFWQSGMRSIGYKDTVVLPLRISMKNARRDGRLGGTVDIGICREVCLPHTLRVSTDLPADITTPDPRIVAAMADLPYSAAEAGVRSVACRLTPAAQGMGLRVEIDMPPGTGREETVIEAGNPQLWVADPETGWQGGKLVAQTRVTHMSGGAFALDRSDLRITVLDGKVPVEIDGCGG